MEFYGFREESLTSFLLVLGAGVGVLALMLYLNAAAGIAIGFPTPFTASSNEFINSIINWLVIVIGAGIGEAMVFRYAILPIMVDIFEIPLLAIPANAVTFAIFHFAAYGGLTGATSGLFIGALIFGLIISSVSYFSKSVTPELIAHPGFNWFLYNKSPLAIVSIGFMLFFVTKRYFKYRRNR